MNYKAKSNSEIKVFEAKTKDQLLKEIQAIDPIRYEKSRNNLSGTVTQLSPYISCGILSLNEIRYSLLGKNKLVDCYKLVQELAWRDYFQSVYLNLGDGIFKSIKNNQEFGDFDTIPNAILEARTGISTIDKAISKLYETGYLHNHERMWLAMLICNIAGTKWEVGAKWMYYYLIDGDLASNSLSWQWVAGTFSSKKYFANQENINKYGLTEDRQYNTFLDKSYEELQQNCIDKIIPEILKDRSTVTLKDNTCYLESFFDKVVLETDFMFTINTITEEITTKNNPVLVYIQNEDWKIGTNRIDFITKQIKLIAPKTKLLILKNGDIKNKEILNQLPEQERMFSNLTEYYPSFFKFWTKAEKLIV
jgi:deoxyribodipyrimidine photo-lyase